MVLTSVGGVDHFLGTSWEVSGQVPASRPKKEKDVEKAKAIAEIM